MFPGGESIRLQASADNHMDRRRIREYLLLFCCYVLIIRFVFLTVTFFSMARFLWHINDDGLRTYIVKRIILNCECRRALWSWDLKIKIIALYLVYGTRFVPN